MKRKLFIAVAVAALSLPMAPVAFARDFDGHYHREERFVVHYHLDGDRTIRACDYREARRIEAMLESLGANAHVDGYSTVHYSMRGSRRIDLGSHGAAHRLADQLQGYGFHAHVDHE